jgi:hypothetical protein
MNRFRIIAGTLLGVAAAVLTACSGGSDPEGEGANVNGGSPTPGVTAEAAAPGSRTNPLPAGASFELADWTVTVGETDLDATDELLAENEFNEISAGRVAVMARVDLVYTGAESGTPWADLSFGFLGAGGNVYNFGRYDYCGVIPNDLADVGEMFPDADGGGNVCVAVPEDEVTDGAWVIEDALALDPERVFVAVA